MGRGPQQGAPGGGSSPKGSEIFQGSDDNQRVKAPAEAQAVGLQPPIVRQQSHKRRPVAMTKVAASDCDAPQSGASPADRRSIVAAEQPTFGRPTGLIGRAKMRGLFGPS